MLDIILLISLPFWGACLGGVIAMKWKNNRNLQPLVLAFSGAFLLSITIFELLPRVYTSFAFQPGYWIILGILLQIVLEYFSKGVEHGHAHAPQTNRFPHLIWLSLGIHALIEGIPLMESPQLAVGLAIHKIPISIALYSLLLHSYPQAHPTNLFGFILLFALFTPIGSILGFFLDGSEKIILPIIAVVIGILLHIATTILFESNEGHRLQRNKLIIILIGFLLGSLL